MNARSMIRMTSAVGIIVSVFYLLAALSILLPVKGDFAGHANLMLLGSLILFPYSVAVAYVASVARNPWPSLLPISVGAVLLYPTPVLADGNLQAPMAVLAALAIAGFLGAASSLMVGPGRKGAVRLSLYLVGITMLGLALASIVEAYSETSIFTETLVLILAFPVPLIYSVTVNSLPSTFSDKPSTAASVLSVTLSIAASVLVGLGYTRPGFYLAAASLVLYLYAARFHRLGAYWRRVSSMPRTPARAGLEYFIQGHVAVVIVTVVVLAELLAYPSRCGVICVIHGLALGFASMHVWIHGPMMVPVILGMRHGRRFNPLPYITLLAAVAVYPLSHPLALVLYVVSLVLDVFVFI